MARKKGVPVFTIQGKLCSVIFMKCHGQEWKKDFEFIDSFEFLVLQINDTKHNLNFKGFNIKSSPYNDIIQLN